MPRRIRQLIADLKDAGFADRAKEIQTAARRYLKVIEWSDEDSFRLRLNGHALLRAARRVIIGLQCL